MEWSPATLERSIPSLPRVRVQPHERSIFWNPLSTHALDYNARYFLNASRHLHTDVVDGAEAAMTPREFFEPPAGTVHYANLGMHEGILGKYAELGRTAALANMAAEPSAPKPSIWLGTAGAVTQMHHDTDHNFYAQLHGEKTFVLYPPSATHEAVYLHPRLHPLSHMPLPRPPSLRDISAGLIYPPYRSRGTLHAQGGALHVQLRRGDVLYIPPFYGHLALCDRACISANIW